MEVLDLEKNSLLNLINHEPDIDKIFLHAEAEDVGIKHWNDSKAFIEYSNNMDNIYKNIQEYNPYKKSKNSNCIWWYDCWYA